MGILSWVIVGGLAGLLAQYLMGEESGCLVAVLIGVIGAVIGGFVLNLFGIGGINGLSLWSIIVATIGAVILLAVFRAFKR
ncbi:MAG: GlsB/YeaQ/YmgE family stress response membrane protein [Actinomycetota bacterium]|nr:GlsB/YeaQ/YmgE family stress response membrane protein [Actinomycetota bacterium]